MDENQGRFCADVAYPRHIIQLADECGIKDPVDIITAFDSRPSPLPKGGALKLHRLQRMAEVYIDGLDAPPEPDYRKHNGAVYFIHMDANGVDFVKIGTAIDPHKRLEGLMTGSPFQLNLVGIIPTGGVALEREWHRRFAHFRVRGEWFRGDLDLVNAIEDALSRNPKRRAIRAAIAQPSRED